MITLLVPYRAAAGSDRERTWNVVYAALMARDPSIRVSLGDDGGEVFSRSASVNAARDGVDTEFIAIWDADTFVSPEHLIEACGILRADPSLSGVRPWTKKSKLTEDATARILSGELALDDRSISDDVDCYSTWQYAAPTVHRLSDFDLVSGMDPRFRGWGSEDTAFGIVMETLVGPQLSLDHYAVHLYHPYTKLGKSRAWENQTQQRPNWNRILAYKAARGNKKRIWKLLGE